MIKRALLLLTLVCSIGTRAHAQCCGDCNGDGMVSINELITAVNNALIGCGAAALSESGTATHQVISANAQCCGDCNGDGMVSINELITAVNNALLGCGVATPTGKRRTPTPTHKPTATPTAVPHCTLSLTDTSGRGGNCFFQGMYNRSCGTALNSVLSTNGVTVQVILATGVNPQSFVFFTGRVTSATSAALSTWSTDGIQLMTTTGTIQLTNGGTELVIFPDNAPFSIQGCGFVQYLGAYTGNSAG